MTSISPETLSAAPIFSRPTAASSIAFDRVTLPHGITLGIRSCGPTNGPVLLFLHGFPEAAFVWDEVMMQMGALGYRAVAPNLRGYADSSAPTDPAQYRVKHLVQDIVALTGHLGCSPTRPLEALIAHDWGGAVAWGFANQYPAWLRRLCSVNSPHPGTFLRDLQSNPAQIAASAYMNFLARPDAPQLLADHDFERLWRFFAPAPVWLTEPVKDQYRAVWSQGLTGGCNYYRASPLRPASAEDAAANAISLPNAMLTVGVPTLVLWGMQDHALLPTLLEGLDAFVPQLRIERLPAASHWVVHEQPDQVAALLSSFLA
jgi:epoxide hydrolase 4